MSRILIAKGSLIFFDGFADFKLVLVYRWPAAALHGDKNQHEREQVLAQFRSGRIVVLVATDIAARGLGKVYSLYPW